MPGILRWWLSLVWSLKWPSINKATPQGFWQLSRKKLDALVHRSNTVLYAGSYWPSVQISNRKETARNSHRGASLRDTLANVQGVLSKKKKEKRVFAFKETISVPECRLTVCCRLHWLLMDELELSRRAKASTIIFNFNSYILLS